MFAAPSIDLPERSWLTSLFEKTELEKEDRLALLTGRPPLGSPDVGMIVCACFNVGEKTIQTAIKEKGLKTHQDVGQCLKAGTNCGSCAASHGERTRGLVVPRRRRAVVLSES